MKLQDALQTSLNELRMQMLGVQVLFGFQFQGLFQEAFANVPASARIADALGLGLLVATLGLSVAIPCQHRMVESGATTLRIYRISLRYANYALPPLAGALACGVYVVTAARLGARAAAWSALLTFLAAAGAWSILGGVLRRSWALHAEESPMESGATPLHTKIDQMLTEARVVLPGVQAMLGFQLIVTLTQAFTRLPVTAQDLHFAALASLVLAIVLLIAPAAVHRLTFGGRDDIRLHALGSALITIALAFLAVAISCDVYIAVLKMFGAVDLALASACITLGVLIALWYVLPLLCRRAVRR